MDSITYNPMTTDQACAALQDFLREWHPEATVKHIHSKNCIASTGGDVGHASKFKMRMGMTLPGIVVLARRMHETWTEKTNA